MYSETEMRAYSACAWKLEHALDSSLVALSDDMAITRLESLLPLYFEDLGRHQALAPAFIAQFQDEAMNVRRHALISVLAGFAASAELRANRWRRTSPWVFGLRSIWDAGQTKPGKLLQVRIKEAERR